MLLAMYLTIYIVTICISIRGATNLANYAITFDVVSKSSYLLDNITQKDDKYLKLSFI